jgi:hypothetical protein
MTGNALAQTPWIRYVAPYYCGFTDLMEGTANILTYIKVIPLLTALEKCHQTPHPYILTCRVALGIHEVSHSFQNRLKKSAICITILSNEKYGKVIGC